MKSKRSPSGHRVGEWHPRTKHRDALVRQAREMRDGGMSYGEIAKALDVNWRTIADWVKYETRLTA